VEELGAPEEPWANRPFDDERGETRLLKAVQTQYQTDYHLDRKDAVSLDMDCALCEVTFGRGGVDEAAGEEERLLRLDSEFIGRQSDAIIWDFIAREQHRLWESQQNLPDGERTRLWGFDAVERHFRVHAPNPYRMLLREARDTQMCIGYLQDRTGMLQEDDATGELRIDPKTAHLRQRYGAHLLRTLVELDKIQQKHRPLGAPDEGARPPPL